MGDRRGCYALRLYLFGILTMSLDFIICTQAQAKGKRNYHAQDFKGDAVLSPPRIWGGSAVIAGLPEYPTLEDFAALVTGRDPATGKRLTPRLLKKPAIAAVYTYPKSVSGLLPFDDRFVGLLDASGRICVEQFEEFALCRDQSQQSYGTYKPSGIAAVVINHCFSDAKDPHIHPHVLPICAAFDPERAWRNLWTSPIVENKKLISARSDAEVAVLIWKLGYDLEPDGDSVRIRGFPRELEAWWSSRGNAITTELHDAGMDPTDTIQRKRQARKSRRGGDKPDTASHLEALRNALPPELLRQTCDLVKDARGTARLREGRDPVSVDDSRAKLEEVLANDGVVPVARAEIQVLKALPIRATKNTFREALEQLRTPGFSRGRHEYLVSPAIVAFKASQPFPEAPGENALSAIELPRNRAIEFVASSNPYPVCVCEVKGAAKFCESLKTHIAGMGDKSKGHTEVMDVSRLALPGLKHLIATRRAEQDRLVLVTEIPNRDYCAVASVLAEPTLPGYSLPVLQENSRKRARSDGHDIPMDALRSVAREKDLLRLARQEAMNGKLPLIVTQTPELAERLNQRFHEDALRSGPVVTVDWFEEMPPASLHRGASAFAFMRQGKPGLRKGSVVSVRRADDRFEMAGPGKAGPIQIPTWMETHVFVLLKKHVIEVAEAEPIIRHSGHFEQAIPQSPFRPTMFTGSATPITGGPPPFWSFGYAVPVALLPEKGPQVGIVFVDEGRGISGNDKAKLGRLMLDSPAKPMVIELATAIGPVNAPPSQSQPVFPALKLGPAIAPTVNDFAPEM